MRTLKELSNDLEECRLNLNNMVPLRLDELEALLAIAEAALISTRTTIALQQYFYGAEILDEKLRALEEDA